MLLIAKLAALGVVIWFYMTAEKNGESPVKWAVIGLIGYLIFWFMVDLIIDKAFPTTYATRNVVAFILGQIPTLGGLVAAHFIRKKLLANTAKNS